MRPLICYYWLGPQIQVVFYALQDSTVYNLVVAVADPEFNARCTEGVDCLPLLRERLSGWDPALKELLSMADSLVRFPVNELEALPSWNKGCVTLMGDSAHPTLPNLGQGAAMGIEDALVLGKLLGSLTEHVSATPEPDSLRKHIPTVLQAYEKLRLPRTARLVAQSRLSSEFNSLPWANGKVFNGFDEATCISDWPWIDSRWNRELLSYRADEVAEQEFARLVGSGALGNINGVSSTTAATTMHAIHSRKVPTPEFRSKL
jgi:2-polyprenyl-6-methoxyphenol hydroxylase-like FAD-dependent oxidoreductase